jgi:hypothetical protein
VVSETEGHHRHHVSTATHGHAAELARQAAEAVTRRDAHAGCPLRALVSMTALWDGFEQYGDAFMAYGR